ncbi:FtsX-like permease family protein [candidate division KSB1 bacterium]
MTYDRQKKVRLRERFLRLFVSETECESFFGDTDEYYSELYVEKGAFPANLWYAFHMTKSIITYLYVSTFWSLIMFRNYLKIAFRNLKRYKGFSFINILGLSLSIAASIFILMYIHYELSYDKFFPNATRIFRITNEIFLGDTEINHSQTPGPPGPAFAAEIPEVLQYARIVRISSIGENIPLKKDAEVFEDSGIFLADSTFFDIFQHTFVYGAPQSALKQPGSIVLTEGTAHRLFGNDDPLGKILSMSGFGIGDMKVTGVIKDLPDNTHMKFNYLISYHSLNESIRNEITFSDWGYFPFHTYVMLDKNANLSEVERKMEEVYQKHSGEKHTEIGARWKYSINKMTDIHLRSHLNGELETNNNIEYIYLQSIVALMIMIIACSNFMNLFVARSTDRAKEIGIRKVFGAIRKNIIYQIFGESLIMIIISLFLGLTAVISLLPFFNSLSGLTLSIPYIFNPQILLFLFFLLVATSLISGVYPAVLLSRFHPVRTIKHNMRSSRKRNYFRRSLVVLQFVISISLIFSTIVVLDQLDFMKDQNLGFDKEQVIIIKVKPGRVRTEAAAFKDLLKMNPEITEASFSTSVPGQRTGVNAFIPEGFQQDAPQIIETVRVDYDFIETYKLEMVSGRPFSDVMETEEQNAYLVNEQTAELLGWSLDESIGKGMQNITTEEPEKKIVGVIKNYHHKSLKNAIAPMIYEIRSIGRYLSLKISAENVSETLSYVEEKWTEFSPGLDLEYFFLDENFEKLYRSEEKLSTLFKYFAFLAVFISGLGLFALATYTAEQRTKDIGIRKVLGAHSAGLVVMMLKSFLGVVLFASVITFPVIYYLMNLWLSSFAFKTDISPWSYVLSVVLALAVAVFTTAHQTIKAASSNPIDSLRYE